MLENGNYPIHLKRRIRGGQGHLSNAQALDVFLQHCPPFMTHLFLSHLSQDNNNPEMVRELFTRHSSGTDIVIASRREPTAIYPISRPAGSSAIHPFVQNFAAQAQTVPPIPVPLNMPAPHSSIPGIPFISSVARKPTPRVRKTISSYQTSLF